MKSFSVRLFLFALTNFAVLAVITLIIHLFGLDSYANRNYNADLKILALACFCWGMIGAFISLAVSRWAAKQFMGITVIQSSKEGNLQWLAVMVEDISRRAGLTTMPEVGIYRSAEANAFATGPSKNRSLVAFSTALIENLDKEAIEGVAAHEVAHIVNGDMVTMTLVQGVINAFILFFARIIAHAASQAVKDRMQRIVYYATLIIAEIAFGFLGLIVSGAFSRKREFRADYGSSKLVGSEKMIKALKYLKEFKLKAEKPGDPLPATLTALGIDGNKKFLELFSTHPAIEKRIDALEKSLEF